MTIINIISYETVKYNTEKTVKESALSPFEPHQLFCRSYSRKIFFKRQKSIIFIHPSSFISALSITWTSPVPRIYIFNLNFLFRNQIFWYKFHRCNFLRQFSYFRLNWGYFISSCSFIKNFSFFFWYKAGRYVFCLRFFRLMLLIPFYIFNLKKFYAN